MVKLLELISKEQHIISNLLQIKENTEDRYSYGICLLN
jgi:hypothetical protein